MTATRTARTNSYAAPCVTCGQTVPAAAGTLTRDDGEWVVRHPADNCGATLDHDLARQAMTADGAPADQIDELIAAAVSGDEPELLQTILDSIAEHFPRPVTAATDRRETRTEKRRRDDMLAEDLGDYSHNYR